MTPEEWERWVQWWCSDPLNSRPEVVRGWKFLLINKKIDGPKDERSE